VREEAISLFAIIDHYSTSRRGTFPTAQLTASLWQQRVLINWLQHGSMVFHINIELLGCSKIHFSMKLPRRGMVSCCHLSPTSVQLNSRETVDFDAGKNMLVSEVSNCRHMLPGAIIFFEHTSEKKWLLYDVGLGIVNTIKKGIIYFRKCIC
jgi:hypothetical protein